MTAVAHHSAETIGRDVPGGRRGHGWVWAGSVIAAIVSVPLLAVVWLAFHPAENIWPHLASTVLPGYLRSTAWLMAGNGLATLVIGAGTAWLVTMCRFPGRGLLEWMLLLPLAVPGYVIAYVYTDLLEFAGPVQLALRAIFGWETARDYWFPDIRTLGGAITVMSLVLYPYVYLLARAAYLEQSACVLEVSRTLGRGPWYSFIWIGLPLARPAIVVGLSLVLMETLNDFGTVDYFAVGTLTAGVFNVWLHMGNAGGAAQIALVMLLVMLALIGTERLARRRRRFHHTTGRYRPLARMQLTGGKAILATLACAMPVLLGFVTPVVVLLNLGLGSEAGAWGRSFLSLARNSLLLSGVAALMAVAVGMVLAYGLRIRGGRVMQIATRLASVGYAVPGAVLAVGVLIPFAALDNNVDAIMRERFGLSTGLVLTGTIFAIAFAYVVRFLAAAFGALDAGLAKVSPGMDMAAKTLGSGPWRTLMRVHLPLLRGSLLTAATLVFVDSMKELPATLILRPFNFETLATHVYQFASDELLQEAAPAALTIVLVGVVPVLLLIKTIGRARPGTRASRSASTLLASDQAG